MAKMEDVVRYLNLNRVPFEVLAHSAAYSAHDVALATHVPDAELAKTLLVVVDDQHWMAVVPGDHQIVEKKLRHALEAKHVHLAHEEDLALFFPECETGAMPPFGMLYALPVVVDRSLTEDREIVFHACTHTQSIRMTFADFTKLVKPVIADIAAAKYQRHSEVEGG